MTQEQKEIVYWESRAKQEVEDLKKELQVKLDKMDDLIREVKVSILQVHEVKNEIDGLLNNKEF